VLVGQVYLISAAFYREFGRRALQCFTVLVDISINHESGGGAKVSVCSRRATNTNSWRMYASIEEAKKVLLAFGVRDDLAEGLNRPMDLLLDLNSREPIDFLSIDVPEDVLAKYGFKVAV
jgi:hypothetical protein